MPNHLNQLLLVHITNLLNLSKPLPIQEKKIIKDLCNELEFIIYSYSNSRPKTLFYSKKRIQELLEILEDLNGFFLSHKAKLNETPSDIINTLQRLLDSISMQLNTEETR